MLYIAFFKTKPGVSLDGKDVLAKSRKWWNEGEKPAGIKDIGIYGALASHAQDVCVFEAQSHDDIHKFVSFWKDTSDIDVFPAVDLADAFRKQGMKIS